MIRLLLKLALFVTMVPSAMGQYFGGDGDGFSVLVHNAQLDGTQFSEMFSGGAGDGFSEATYNGEPSGFQWTSLYHGGHGDGSANNFYSGMITGTTFTLMYAGGSGDGFHQEDFTGMINGVTVALMFMGGGGDGSDQKNYNGFVSGLTITEMYQGGNGDGGGSEYLLVSPLPIQLLYFKAKGKNGTVELEWATASEVNNDYFSIERSQDMEQVETVAVIQSKGDLSEAVKYNVIDYHPLPGTSYYRVKQTDYDGTSTDSPWLVVTTDTGKEEMQLYPNPTGGHWVNIALPVEHKEMDEVIIRIYTKEGHLVLAESMGSRDRTNGTYFISFNDRLSPGIYLVKITLRGRDFSQRLVIN
ncbi:CHU large protein [Fulvivirga imtechensis AK7]|uniref:CHU large protein n=2 Tax=Fulvivirga TaxID=396811 RepID=L8JT07_9BACT|nr:CHU large protein [Fulvivirga imtechensis AK7]